MEQSYWLVGIAFAVGLAVYTAYWRGAFKFEKKPVHLGALMARNGIDVKQIVDAGLEDELVRSAQECVRCNRRKDCEECLLNGDPTAYGKICPNAAFLDGLKAEKA